MPGYDGTGPRGMGPMTGGGRGYCALPAGTRPRIGRFFGRGGGRGWRNMYYATGLTGWQRAGYPVYDEVYPYVEPTADEEREILNREAETLKRGLEDIQNRLETLEKARNDK